MNVTRGCSGGHVWLLGGMHGCSQGGAWLLRRHAWLLLGACMVAPRGACMVVPGGMHGCSWGGMRGCLGACVVALGGAWLLQGGAWFLWGRGVCMVALGGHSWDTTRYGDTVNERAVRILLECILVKEI